MEYEQLPSATDLARVAKAVGIDVSLERRIQGGQSATTDILATEKGHRVVLRRHGRWSVGFDDKIAVREEAVLRTVRDAGVPAPIVLWAGRLGATTAIITEYVNGAADIRPTDQMPWAERLAIVLAAIHSIEVKPALASLLREAPLSPVDLEPSPMFDNHPSGHRLLARRAALSPAAGSATSLVHGDYWPGNLLWRANEIVAVLDWEAAVLGEPASDVAYCFTELHYLGLEQAADHFIATYRDVTGAELRSLPYWVVTALCRALPELDSYLDGWASLGYKPDPGSVRERLDRLIDETLAS